MVSIRLFSSCSWRFGLGPMKIIKYRNKSQRTIDHKKLLCYETEGNCFLNVLILNRKILYLYYVRNTYWILDDRRIIEKMLPRKNCNFSQMKIEIKSFCSTRHTAHACPSSHSMDEDSLRIVMRRNQSLITMFLCSNNCRSFIHNSQCAHCTAKRIECRVHLLYYK